MLRNRSEIYLELYGPISFGCGGDSTASSLEASQAAFAKTAEGDNQIAFSEQQRLLASQQAKLQQIATNPQGYSPEQLHIASTSINDNTARAAKQAIGAAAQFGARGGATDISSPAAGQMAAGLLSAAAQNKASNLAQVAEQSQELKTQNMWKAISGLNEIGSQYGRSAESQGNIGVGAADASVKAGQLALAAKQSGMQQFGSMVSGLSGLAVPGASLLKGAFGSGGGGGGSADYTPSYYPGGTST